MVKKHIKTPNFNQYKAYLYSKKREEREERKKILANFPNKNKEDVYNTPSREKNSPSKTHYNQASDKKLITEYIKKPASNSIYFMMNERKQEM